MTAEAVVMNKSAVAMAADSAVTISAGRRGLKTFDTVNKLFELIKGQPIGFMVFADAQLNGMPWETILKVFRDEHRGLRLPYLEDYVEAFEKYLRNNRELIKEESEVGVVLDNAYNAFMPVFEHVRERKDRCVSRSGRLVMTKVRALIDEAISACSDELDTYDNAPWAKKYTTSKLKSEYGKAIELFAKELFEHYSIKTATRDNLIDLAIKYLRKQVHDPAASGLVFCGFGTRDYLPKLHTAHLRGALDNNLLKYRDFTVEIRYDYPSHLHTFAQDNEARAYLSGITKEVLEQVVEYWTEWVNDSRLEISGLLDTFSNLPDAEKAQLEKAFHNLARDRVRDFLKHMQKHQDSEFIDPLWESISFLPKDELAIFAESLVNLTSLKQRVSIRDLPTVGGAIDVALISPGDGFVWIKRKHYFTQELNPSWPLTHHGMIETIERTNNKTGTPRKQHAK